MTPDMWTCLLLFLLFLGALLAAMKLGKTTRFCHRCAQDGDPELLRCPCGWTGSFGHAHYCIDGTLLCPKCDTLLRSAKTAST